MAQVHLLAATRNNDGGYEQLLDVADKLAASGFGTDVGFLLGHGVSYLHLQRLTRARFYLTTCGRCAFLAMNGHCRKNCASSC